jgi:hypothetical protein
MTIDPALRAPLTSGAQGPAAGAGWDDVVRRGRHRQRVRRARGTALGALVAGGIAAGIALAADDPTVQTVPPATAPTSTAPEPQPSVTTSTSTETVLDARSIQGARAQGAFLTVIIPAADPSTELDPCTDLHPRVVESAERIEIELLTEEADPGSEWASCLSSPFSGRAMVELTDPVGDRALIDLPTGHEITVIDGASLLFPTELPEAFTPGVWDEFGVEDTWTFSWSTGDLFVNVTTRYGGTGECDRQTIAVRGTTGRLCDSGQGFFDLHWEEEGRTIAVELGASDPEQDSGFTVEDALAIAEGLEPYDDVGPEALGS